ncbi:MAG: DUF2239 family protein [Myxococcales bacterium]|nr:MAG: DUF2239 family protein [Myxococcales bacterium]
MAAAATYTAFAGVERVVRGTLEEMLRAAKKRLDAEPDVSLLIFEDATGKQVDFDLRGTVEQVVARARPELPERAGPGRPKLGVVSREVSLLPRHWEWLERHPQGISAAIRRLVDEARKRAPDEDRAREARAAASRFMWVMAGDLPKFEEASRALFTGNKPSFAVLTRFWPAHVREHLDELLREGGAFDAGESKPSKKK